MTHVLILAAVVAQGLDLAGYLLAPHLETGALAGQPVGITVVAKITGVVLALLIVAALHRSPGLQAAGLALLIGMGAFGAGTAAAVIGMTP